MCLTAAAPTNHLTAEEQKIHLTVEVPTNHLLAGPAKKSSRPPHHQASHHQPYPP